ncbi:MAG: FAD-dependent monooxygenase [Deferribacteres bacterium]|nr:FAD-dependent monooxygenase [candidate division KSB1 bacterium]MCB9504399.1 FAD-dependent monooxygenase [Deferribacteres bacterium]
MFGKKKPEVLIVGAGPVGLMTALELTKNGVVVQVIDKEWQRAGHSYALALHPQSLRMFKKLGLLDKILQHCYKVNTIDICDEKECKATINLAELKHEYAYITAIQQNVLEKILEDALLENGVKVLWHHRLAHLTHSIDHANVIIDKLETDTLGYIISRTEQVVTKSIRGEIPYVIGADGHYSFVRRSLDINFDPVGDTLNCAVFEFKTDIDLQNKMALSFTEGAANVMWPLPNGYCRWSFQLLDREASQESRIKERYEVQIGTGPYAELTENYLKEILSKRAPWFKGKVEDIRWRHIVRFERRLSDALGKNKCWLAGDATHMTNPVGIQGMNGGFLEAQDLTAAVIKSLKEKESPELFAEYNEKWLNQWRFLLGLDGRVETTAKTDPWIAQHKGALLSSIPALSEDLKGLLGQIELSI